MSERRWTHEASTHRVETAGASVVTGKDVSRVISQDDARVYGGVTVRPDVYILGNRILNRFVLARFTFPGLHQWPMAPKARAYLASTHRHVFHVQVGVAVEHNERQIECHDLADLARGAIPGASGRDGLYMLGDLSCEAIAEAIGLAVAERWNRFVYVEVMEDGECGARVEVGRG